jgi:hypothetical protein
VTRAPTVKEESPGSSTTPAPSLPNIKGAVARPLAPESMVWSSGVTPAAVIRTISPTRSCYLHQLQASVSREGLGAYGVGVEYAYTMVRGAPATNFLDYILPPPLPLASNASPDALIESPRARPL